MHGFGEPNHLKNTTPCCNSRLAACIQQGKSQEKLVHTSRLTLKEAKATEIWDYSYFKANLQHEIASGLKKYKQLPRVFGFCFGGFFF